MKVSFQTLSPQERIQRITSYLEEISPDQNLEAAKEQLQSASGPDAFGEQLEIRVAGSDDSEGLETLDILIRDRNRANVTTRNLDRLEAIIHKKGRPAIDIVNDSFNAPSGEWSVIGSGETKKRIENAIPSIGRIEIPNDIRPYAGTGFVVGKNLLMTNRHVATLFAIGVGQKNLRFDPGQVAAIDFKREIPRRSSPDPILLDVTKILMIHPYWDMALLEVDGLPEDHGPLQVSTKRPEEMTDQRVVVIGYPALDSRSNVGVQKEIFDGVFEVKRLAPGKMTGRCEYQQWNGKKIHAAAHDSSTLGGNSGSAVIDIDTGEVVGLHFAGVYLKTNYAVSMRDLAEDTRVVDAGVNFSGRVAPADFYGPIWTSTDSAESVPDNSKPVLQSGLSLSASTYDTKVISAAGVTVPIRVTISSLPSTTAIKSGTAETEGLFTSGTNANDYVSRFSKESLVSSEFGWNAALSAALASHVAYSNKADIEFTALSGWGLESCEFIQRDSTRCFVAASADSVLVAFRGTATVADLLTDLNALSTSCDYGRVHRGFLAAFRAVDAQLRRAIEEFPGRSLVLTGHSLGGALATIAAAEWQSVSTMAPVASVYTFGQPGVGKGRFPTFVEDYFGDRFYRFVNDDDIIPMVPPTYRHVGKLFHLDASGSAANTESLAGAVAANCDSGAAMLTQTQFDRLRAQLLSERSRRTDGVPDHAEEGLLPSFSDHRIANYVAKIAAITS